MILYICCFCLSSKTLALLKEVDVLKVEVGKLRQSINQRNCNCYNVQPQISDNSAVSVPVREVDDGGEKVDDDAGSPNSSVEPIGKAYGAAVRDLTSERKASPRGASQMASRRRSSEGRASKKPKTKEFVGRRKLWGTKK